MKPDILKMACQLVPGTTILSSLAIATQLLHANEDQQSILRLLSVSAADLLRVLGVLIKKVTFRNVCI